MASLNVLLSPPSSSSSSSSLCCVFCCAARPSALSIADSSGILPTASRGSWLKSCLKYRKNAGSRMRLEPLSSVFPAGCAEVSSVQDLFEFICEGPLLDKVGITPEKVLEDVDKWLQYGLHLCRLFQLNELFLNLAQKVRLYHYYIPVILWCEDQIAQHRSNYKDGEDIPPLVIGFSAPQGCGKSTLVFALHYLFQITGRRTATLSIDDFYLTAEGQAELRERNPGNLLLELRGNAGSHDLPFSVETLTTVTKLTKEGIKMKLPRYDKAAYSGRGDRADHSVWPEVEGPLMAVLFEGWMLGFKPLPVDAVKAVDSQALNRTCFIARDRKWDKLIKAWCVSVAPAGRNCHERSRQAWEEVKDFVSRYLPAYKAYLPTLYSEGPNGSDPGHLLVVEIDEGRNPILAN